MTTRTSAANFEGFSLTLNEQSAERKYGVCSKSNLNVSAAQSLGTWAENLLKQCFSYHDWEMSYKIGARSQTSHYVTIAAGNLSIIATPSSATKNARHPRLCCGPCQVYKGLQGDTVKQTVDIVYRDMSFTKSQIYSILKHVKDGKTPMIRGASMQRKRNGDFLLSPLSPQTWPMTPGFVCGRLQLSMV